MQVYAFRIKQAMIRDNFQQQYQNTKEEKIQKVQLDCE